MPKWSGLARLSVALVLSTACSADDGNPPPLDPTAAGTGMTFGPMTGDPSGNDDTGDSTGGEANCGTFVCTGNGTCKADPDGMPYCACDEGYKLDEGGQTCIVDESCIKVRFLEDYCRQYADGPPAVALFFGVDFCSGTAVTSAKFEALGLKFVVLENGIDVIENVESGATIVPTSVESYVTLALDVSDSVTQSGDLPALVAELRGLVAALQPAAGEPDVYVSIYVFGRFVAEYVPFTRDFASVDQALTQIESNPASVVGLVGGNGTALYHAVAKGIDRTQRIRDLRDAVTWGGVLSTGTVVVITDGKDTSNAMLDTAKVGATVNQVISIGISADVDHRDLEAIGRDGSFLSPTPSDWAAAFDEVAARVSEYPDRAYLLGYCSSATVGDPIVEVSVASRDKITVEQTASCKFDADLFSSDPAAVCHAGLFTAECDAQACGGLTACGACADDECCAFSQCMSPVSADDAAIDCAGNHELCAATAEVCGPNPDPEAEGDVCLPPPGVGDACTDDCDPGVTWCDDGQCVAALPLGAECDGLDDCASNNCQQTNPDNPLEVRTCQRPALAHDRCESNYTRCEQGAFCSGTTCTPKYQDLISCSQAGQCRSGECEAPVQQTVCTRADACFWPWTEKVPI